MWKFMRVAAEGSNGESFHTNDVAKKRKKKRGGKCTLLDAKRNAVSIMTA